MVTITVNGGKVQITSDELTIPEQHGTLMAVAVGCLASIRNDVEEYDLLKDKSADDFMNSLLFEFLNACVEEGIIPERKEK